MVYVNSQAVGANDGTSWTNAFSDLQDALDDARNNDGCPCEIWIAAGTYRPDRGTGDRSMSFFVPAGVALYGGFAGGEECRDQRDWVANETILSGDLNGDDGPRDYAEVSDCCREHDYPGCDDPLCQELVCGGALNKCCQAQPPEPERADWYFDCVNSAAIACCHLGNWRACENSIAIVRLGEGEATTVMDGLIVERTYSVHDGSAVISGGVIGSNSTALIHHVLFRTNVPRGAAGFADLVVFDSVFEGNLAALSAFHGEIKNTSFAENYTGMGLGGGTLAKAV